jgi:hypothetical protein
MATKTPGRRCQKYRYRDEISAKLALSQLIRQDKEGHTERRAYACPKCRGYHLTSMPLGQSAGAQRSPQVSPPRGRNG